MQHVIKQTEFTFRAVEDKKTGAKAKRATEVVELAFPLASEILVRENYASEESYAKGVIMLQACVDGAIKSYARELLENCTAETFPHAQVTWEFLANLPPAVRTGGGIPAVLWDEFIEDYIAVMPAITGKTEEQVRNAAALLQRRLSTVKTSKEHLKFFQLQLAMYMESPKAGEYMVIIEFLNEKINEYLGLGAEQLLKNL